MSDELPLPPMHEATLSPDEVRALFDDIAGVATVLGYNVKGGATVRASEAPGTLGDAVALMLSGGVLGLQVRYRHDGNEWWDTVLALSSGVFRLVRIEQRWDQANGGSSPRRV